MPAATVVSNMDGRGVDKSFGHTDQKEYQNLMAVTGNGVVINTNVYKVTIDPSSLIDAAGETQQVTACTGVVLGRTSVRGIVFPYDAQDITVTAYVQANNVIELRFQNEGAATVNLASGVYYIITDTIAAGV